MSEKNDQVAQVPPVPNVIGVTQPAAFLSVFGTEDRPIVMSFDPKTPEGGELLQRVEEAPDEGLKELANLDLTIRHVYAKVIDYTRPGSDEVIQLLRIALVTTDGKVHACCADGVRESILRLMQRHGVPPWKNGVKVTVKLKPTRNQHQRLVLLENFDKPKGGK